jgi:hypothetical protein
MGDLNDLAAKLKRISASIEPNVDKLLKDVAMAVDEEVVRATPVDTGRARANWQMSLNEPAQGVLYPQPQKPPTPESGAERSVAEGRDVLSQYKTGDTVYITNRLPYIGLLDAGHSAQAPANFVARSVQRARSLIKGAAGRIFIEVKKG